MGYVEHSEEITRPDANGREFQSIGDLVFTGRSCFVLTAAGVAFAQQQQRDQVPLVAPLDGDTSAVRVPESSDNVPSQETTLPKWDNFRRELYYGGALVKQFKLPSTNQESVLTVFQEENWPPRIDDPLPHTRNVDPKQRLRETIRSLNRNQKRRLLRFKGDGTGEGILWEQFLDTVGDVDAPWGNGSQRLG